MLIALVLTVAVIEETKHTRSQQYEYRYTYVRRNKRIVKLMVAVACVS